MSRHFLDGSELGHEGFRALVDRALALRGGAAPQTFPGKRLGAVFLNPSLRTRTSLDAACHMLGVHCIALQPGSDAWAMEVREGAVMDGDKPEHIRDAVKVLGGYVDVLAVRSFAKLLDPEEDRADPVLASFVRHGGRPIVNLESARWHPLQGLADAATWVSRLGPDLRGVPLTLTWAPHPKGLPQAVPDQVVLSGALCGMDVTIAHPEGFDLDPLVLEQAQGAAGRAGGSVRVVHDQAEGLRGARVVVAKSWSGFSYYGKRDQEALDRAARRDWTVTAEKMARTADAGFMHCLPVRRNVVVADEVIDGPQSWVFEEAHLRLWTAAALLERILGEKSWNA